MVTGQGSKGASSNRLPIATMVMRQLMFASGGRCAMTDCGLPLVSPSGGWIGTVAHIVGAEKDGPRGSGPETAEERRSFNNLILMCATHGREVDTPDTGEMNFPISRLQAMKAAHETKVSDAVARAIQEDVTGVRTATGVIDTALRKARVATTAEGLAESMLFTADSEMAALLEALSEARSRLQRLSQPALDTLSQLLGVWMLVSRRDDKGQGYEFGDSTASHPTIAFAAVENRVTYGGEDSFSATSDELTSHGLLSIIADEYEHVYVIKGPWPSTVANQQEDFWICAAWFLYEGHGVGIDDWVRTLDFSVFDRAASPERPVPWR